jgi:hypothetical protein
MAIVRAKYSKSKSRTKAHIRYIEHRAGREGEKVKRELFGIDGVMNRQQAYQMIDEGEKGTAFSVLSLVLIRKKRTQRKTYTCKR